MVPNYDDAVASRTAQCDFSHLDVPRMMVSLNPSLESEFVFLFNQNSIKTSMNFTVQLNSSISIGAAKRSGVKDPLIGFGGNLDDQLFSDDQLGPLHWCQVREIFFLIPFEVKGMGSKWQFSFWLWTKRTFVWFIIKRKFGTMTVFLSIWKDLGKDLSECEVIYLNRYPPNVATVLSIIYYPLFLLTVYSTCLRNEKMSVIIYYCLSPV